MRHLSIARRVFAVLGLGAILTLVMAMVLFWALQRATSESERLLGSLMAVDGASFELATALEKGQAQVLKILRERDIDTLEESVRSFEEHDKVMRGKCSEMGEAAVCEALGVLARKNRALVDEALKGHNAIAQQRFVEESNPAAQEAWMSIGAVRKHSADRIGTARLEMDRSTHAIKWTIAAVISAGVVGYLLLGVGIGRGIAASLRRTTAMLRDIAEGEGDLTKRLDDTGDDEMGQLAKWFNAFVKKVHGTVGTVAESTGILSASSEELSVTAANLADAAHHMSGRAQSASASVEVSARKMTSVSEGTGEVSMSVSSVTAAIEQMSTSLRDVAESCQKESRLSLAANEKSQSARQTMERLSSAVNEIGNVVGLIRKVAEQTNLLALNATIEAASAGAAGKGFAVVAGEVKELARQTADATGQVIGRVSEVRESTDAVLKAIADVADTIRDVHEISQEIARASAEQTTTVGEVASRLSGANAAVAEMVGNIGSSTKDLAAVTADVSSVSAAAGETSQHGAEIQKSSTALAGLAAQLQQIVGQFRV
jgi:methyl-accepting chemotaxis protein